MKIFEKPHETQCTISQRYLLPMDKSAQEKCMWGLVKYSMAVDKQKPLTSRVYWDGVDLLMRYSLNSI